MIKKILVGLLFCAAVVFAQQRTGRPAIYEFGGFVTFAHVSAGGQWTTQFIVTGGQYDIGARADDGTPYVVSGSDGSSEMVGSTAGTVIFTITSPDSNLHIGWASSHCEGGCARVTMVLRNTIASTGYVSEATEQGMVSVFDPDVNYYWSSSVSLQYDNSGYYHSSIALTDGDRTTPGNTHYPTMPVTITTYDASGNQVGTHLITLTQFQHVTFRLEDEFPETINTAGTMTISVPSDQASVGRYPPPLAVTAQRFYINGNSQAFTVLPIN